MTGSHPKSPRGGWGWCRCLRRGSEGDTREREGEDERCSCSQERSVSHGTPPWDGAPTRLQPASMSKYESGYSPGDHAEPAGGQLYGLRAIFGWLVAAWFVEFLLDALAGPALDYLTE